MILSLIMKQLGHEICSWPLVTLDKDIVTPNPSKNEFLKTSFLANLSFINSK